MTDLIYFLMLITPMMREKKKREKKIVEDLDHETEKIVKGPDLEKDEDLRTVLKVNIELIRIFITSNM